jgi:hypothetical protein
MANLKERLGKGFWNVSYNGKIYKRKVNRTIKRNYVIIEGKKITVN